MTIRKDSTRLGFRFEPAKWRATNARFSLMVIALIFLAATAGAARAADQVTTDLSIRNDRELHSAMDRQGRGFF